MSYKLELRFRETTAQVTKQQDRMLETTAKRAVVYAKQRARVKSGEMRDSIGYRKIAPGQYELFIGAPHGLFHELGTSRIPAQPMLRPGIAQAASELGAGSLIIDEV